MKHTLLLFLLLPFLACKEPVKSKPIIPEIKLIKADTVVKGIDIVHLLSEKFRFLDSNHKFAALADLEKEKMHKNEVDYYKTEDDKFLRRFYKAQKQYNTYVHFTNLYNDSLRMTKK